MQYYRSIFQVLLILITGITADYTVAANQLANHPSPYLALHGEDPVDWRSWQAEVFESAKADNRLVFVSVGYFSCHWCHVMHQESYQNTEIAKLLNQKYISVKVDRELDPDLDQRLIDFVATTRGYAGWPLNVFLTPDGYPVTGFTYLPPDQFARVLQELDQTWQQNHISLAAAARKFFQTQTQDLENQVGEVAQVSAEKMVEAFVAHTMQAADILQGGIGSTSKFPNVPQLDTLLGAINANYDLGEDVVSFVNLTLQAMASRNLQDHVNGGFFRYTTDPDWQTPHFEKMLYDNAQLAALYLKAQRLWPEQEYAEVALRTLDFVEANLKHVDGGYMSSLSAVDIDNKEGGAYLWTLEQLAAVLDEDELAYLLALMPPPPVSSEFMIAPLIGPGASGEPERNLIMLHKLQSRGSKSMPADDKRLAGWNALMLKALTAATKFAPRFTSRAHSLFRNMQANFYRDGSLIRLAGNATVADAVLEDYAQVAEAFLEYGRELNNDDAITIARQLTERAYRLFLKEGRWQEKARTLIPIAPGKWIIPDQVLFSPMTLWLKVALELPQLDPMVRETATTMLQRTTRELLNSPYIYGSFIMLRAEKTNAPKPSE
jgi:hypothetical protein